MDDTQSVDAVGLTDDSEVRTQTSHRRTQTEADTEMERLRAVIDSSLKVRKRHQFYLWCQGVLQSLVPHDLLVCAVADPSSSAFIIDCFSLSRLTALQMGALCHADRSIMSRVMRLWQTSGWRPILIEPDGDYAGQDPQMDAAMHRLQLRNIAAHGTYDVRGTPRSFFSFSRIDGPLTPRHTYMLEITVPFLHAAFLRTHLEANPEERLVSFAGATLTDRETEILRWVQQGKSNAQIASILGISPLTVKNHVQNLLRKLNVQNRAQAAAKGMLLETRTSGGSL
jgi:transcriptional regulator EpsA